MRASNEQLPIADPVRAKEIWPEIFDVLERAERGAWEQAVAIARKYGIGREQSEKEGRT